MFLILAVLFCFFPFQKLIGDHFRVNVKKNGDYFEVGDHFRVGIVSGSVQILLPLRAFSFPFLLFLILSFCFLLQASNSNFCTFRAFLCWNHSIAFLQPFLSFFHGFHRLELHFFSCSSLFLIALLFVASWRLLQESIYLLYFWTNTTCSFFLSIFCFGFGHQEIEPFSQGTLVNIGFGMEGVIESCGNLIPQFSSLRVPLSGLRKIWSPYLSQKWCVMFICPLHCAGRGNQGLF